MNYLTYNGKNSSDYGVYIGGQWTFNSARRDYEKVSIPGRNGDLIKDNGRFSNITVSYPVVIVEDFSERADALNAWLASSNGYCRLEDTYHPDYYRMAAVSSAITYDTGTLNKSGKGKITFDCKPQKWLKAGEQVLVYNGNSTFQIPNTTKFESRPLIKVYGVGSCAMIINNTNIVLRNINQYVIIDSELMDCYKGTTNMNANFKSTGGFPVFKSGINTFSYNGSAIQKVEITPRWYTI